MFCLMGHCGRSAGGKILIRYGLREKNKKKEKKKKWREEEEGDKEEGAEKGL